MTDATDVLIVEDEPVVLKVAGMALSAQGVTFETATDVTSAASLLEARTFKVVLTDLKLPGESGFELLKLTRHLAPSPQVIMITGYATVENTLASFHEGCFDFLPKPFDIDELASVVQRALRYSLLEVPAPPTTASRYLLGRHSWAELDPDGSATLGIGDTLSEVAGPLKRIECTRPEDHTVQGQCFCKLVATDGLIHRVWAPLSGRVIVLNSAVPIDLEPVEGAPLAAGWLVRVIPNNLDKELTKLSRAGDPVST